MPYTSFRNSIFVLPLFLPLVFANQGAALELSALTLFGCNEKGEVDHRLRMNSGPVDAAWDVFLHKGSVADPGRGDHAEIHWLNDEDQHTIAVPLETGTHEFTFHVESVGGWTFSGMNLFFDDTNDRAGISVMARIPTPDHPDPKLLPNTASKTMGWPVEDIPAAGTLIYNRDDAGLWCFPETSKGSFQVRLVDFRLTIPTGVTGLDLVGPHGIGPSEKPDCIGRLVLEVSKIISRPSDLFLWLQTNTGLTLGGPSRADDWRAAFSSKTIPPPFSFLYDGVVSSDLIKSWELATTYRNLDGNRSSQTVVYSDPKTGLEARWEGMEYRNFKTLEWTLHLKNNGKADTPIISDVRALDTTLTRESGEEFTLHSNCGDSCTANSYEPVMKSLGPGEEFHSAPSGGRPTNFAFPYFNLRAGKEGVIVVVGWPGQWAATFSRDQDKSIHFVAGQELTRFRLHPGEEIRTPLIVMQFADGGDWVDAQNTWRQWMIEYNIPRPVCKQLPLPGFVACSSHQFAEMTKANERNQIEFIDSYLNKGLKLDYWWMDAGWYVGAAEKGWPWTGTWEVDRSPDRFPNGLRAVSDHAHSKGVKIIVWFEPERVASGTWLATEHPEWILGNDGGLLNLGNPEAWNWLVNHIDKILTDEGIDLYRQDFNIDPLSYWKANDTEDRQGITENKYVVGYLAYWDELLRRHPGMLIDSCASGGRRNDLETMRRAIPLIRSDYLFEPVGQQGHTYGLSFWFPFYGTGYTASNTVGWGWGTGGLSYNSYFRRSNMCPNNTACFDFRVPVDDELILKLYHEWLDIGPNYFGDYYPLTEYSLAEDAWLAWQFHRSQAGQGMIQAFRRSNSRFFGGQLKLRGLNPDVLYEVANFDSPEKTRRSGQDLMDQGIEIVIKECPGAAVLTYRKVDAEERSPQ